jgi:hypothetical protein
VYPPETALVIHHLAHIQVGPRMLTNKEKEEILYSKIKKLDFLIAKLETSLVGSENSPLQEKVEISKSQLEQYKAELSVSKGILKDLA